LRTQVALSVERELFHSSLRRRRGGRRQQAARRPPNARDLVILQEGKGAPLTFDEVEFDTIRLLDFRQPTIQDHLAMDTLEQVCCYLWQRIVGKFEKLVDRLHYTFEIHTIIVLYTAITGLQTADGHTIIPRQPDLAPVLPWGQHLDHFRMDVDTLEYGAFNFRAFVAALEAIHSTYIINTSRGPETKTNNPQRNQ
jgi:hypothetical protein